MKTIPLPLYANSFNCRKTVRNFFWVYLIVLMSCIPRTGWCQTPTPIACGQTITNGISTASGNDQYVYSGVAGQNLLLSFVGYGDCTFYGNNAQLDLYSPGGQKITSLTHCGVRSTNLTLAASGDYTILVHDANYGAKTASYSLSIQSFTGGGCGGTAIACGQTVTNSIPSATKADAYGFEGVAGQNLAVSFAGYGDCTFYGNNAQMDFYDPTGHKITTLKHCGVRSTNLTLTASGTYTLLVHDANYGATTTKYSLSLQSFTDGGCEGRFISCGQTVTNSIQFPSTTDGYGYQGGAGQNILLSFVGYGDCTFYGNNAQMDFYDPIGKRIATLNHCGVRSTNLTLLATGAYTILVHDARYGAATSSYGITLTVFGGCSADTTTVLASSANPAPFGQPVTFTAAVSAKPPGSGTPTGTVQFQINGQNFGVAVPLTGGIASSSSTTLSPATYTVTATYSGDGHFNGSSDTLTQMVARASTSTTLVSSAPSSVFGQPVTFKATMTTTSPAFLSMTGTVQFQIDGQNWGTAIPLSADKAASLQTGSLSIGAHTVMAVYSGEFDFEGSSNLISQTVGKAATTMDIASSVNPSFVGQTITLTATVAAVAPGAGTPSGTVQFAIDGSGSGPTAQLTSVGTASITDAGLPEGTHVITANYLGDGNFAASTGNLQPAQSVVGMGTPVTLTMVPNGGSYSNSVLVTLSSPTPGAVIRYTTDGSAPTSSSPVYAFSLRLTKSATINAQASAPGYSDSAILSASFTITHPALPDLNGDGIPDLILQDTNGDLRVWFMSPNGTAVSTGSFLNPSGTGDPAWRLVDCGDFTGSGNPDLLFQHKEGSLAVWKMEGTNMISSDFLNPANHGVSDWKAIATADFDNDGESDILFQSSTGDLVVWFMDDLNLSHAVPLNPKNPGLGWKAVGAGDFNGDGNTDILFQSTDGSLAVWFLTNQTDLLLPVLLNPSTPGDPNWTVAGVTDLNGDGKPDLLFQHQVSGDLAVWYMDGTSLSHASLLTPSNPGSTWNLRAP
jgi:hypothetical protein